MVNTMNILMIGTHNDRVTMGNAGMTPEQARVTAAYLVLMADVAEVMLAEKGPTFEECMEAVSNT